MKLYADNTNLRVIIEDELDYVTAAGANNRLEVNE